MNPNEQPKDPHFQMDQSIENRAEISNHNLVNLNEHDFVEAVKKNFDVSISQIEKVTRGFSSEVYRAVSEGKVIFIRINKDPDIFSAEEKGYKILENLGIPVPKVIDFKEKPAEIDHPTIILSAAEGMPVNRAGLSSEDENLVYEQMGNVLRRINEVPLEGFGHLKVEGDKLKGKFSSWNDYWTLLNERFSGDAKTLQENGLLTSEEIEKLAEVYKELMALDFNKPSFLHLDFHGEHVFVIDSKITGVIDLGAIKAGDPRYDIAMSFMFQNAKQREAFKKGYGDLANDPLVQKYLLTISAKKIVFRDKMKKKNGVEIATQVFRETFKELFKTKNKNA